MLNLLWHELRSRRTAILLWGLGLSFFPIVYVGLYPSFADQMAGFQEILDLAIYQALGISMGSFEEYMASTVLNLVPVILSVYAVASGTATLAGEEEDGRLELIVALPIPRWQIVMVKAIALGIALFLILVLVSGATALTMVVIGSQVETAVTPFGVFTSLLASWPLVFAFAMLSLFLAAFCPTRRIASGLAALIVIASYLGNNLTGMIDSLEPIKGLFLFNYYDASADGLLNGQDPVNMLILLVVALVAFGLAVFFFGRRDITVHMWPWQRGRVPASATA